VSRIDQGWVKSSHSGDGACVAVRRDGSSIQVRDTKDPGGPVLTFTRREWTAFLAGVNDGEFDLTPDRGE
jgi:Domain of unknown function (DUF397)